MRKLIPTIIRILLELTIIILVYFETGIFTALFALLITGYIEVKNWFDVLVSKELKHLRNTVEQLKIKKND